MRNVCWKHAQNSRKTKEEFSHEAFSHLTALLLTLAMLLNLVSIAHAEEKQSATAWLLYFASNHETDSSKFPWWPQHKSADQPSSETGVEATNAEVTGPGMYTVGLKFN